MIKISIITVAVAQTFYTDDVKRNYARAEQMIEEAAKKGAKLIVFPEFMNYAVESAPEYSEPVPDGETCRFIAKMAQKHKMWVNLGSIHEKSDDKPYNTSVLFSPDGEINAIYRKLHLADMRSSKEARQSNESDKLNKGDKIVVTDTSLGKIGMSICYDIRFPELYRLMSDKGAKIICHPACFGMSTGSAHWEVLLRSAAILNHCYILASDHCGRRPNGARLWGHSMIIDPFGTVIAEAGQEKEALLVADIDLDYCDETKECLGCMNNRRTDIYKLEEL